MIRSMTGFARVDKESGGCIYSVEMKALNSKYLYVDVSVVNGYADLEIRTQRFLRENIKRGSIKVNLDITFVEPEKIVQPDIGLAGTYYEALKRIINELDLKDEITIDTIIRNRDIIRPKISVDLAERLWSDLENVLRECVGKLNEDREREGERLKTALQKYLADLNSVTGEIEALSGQIVEEARQVLKSRIEQIVSVQFDELRLEQEIAILAEKADISEELVRIRSHIISMRDLLDRGEDCGVQLDFLCQELHREFSTVASKSRKLEISKKSVEGRTLVNKLREQVQNIQ